MARLSEECFILAADVRSKGATLGELFTRAGPKGPAFLSLFFALPFILWIAVPGLSTLFSIFFVINGIQIARKKSVWLPAFFAKKKFSGEKLSKIFETSGKWVKKIEKSVRPRLSLLSSHPFFRSLTGVCISASGFYLLLPFPPGTNFPPAIGIALFALALLEEDGLFMLFGYALFLINTFLFLVLPLIGIRFLYQQWM